MSSASDNDEDDIDSIEGPIAGNAEPINDFQMAQDQEYWHQGDDDMADEDGNNHEEEENVAQEDDHEVNLPPVVPIVVPGVVPVAVKHGQAWVADGEVSIDVGLNNRRTRILWPGNDNNPYDALPVRPELDYFKLMWPMHLNVTMLEQTNALLTRIRSPTTTLGEMFKYFGIRLNMTLDRVGVSISDFWNTQPTEGSTFVPPNYGRFGMTRHRFQTLSRCMRFADYDEGIVNEDPWCPIRPFINGFNYCRGRFVYVSGDLVIDECMSSWRGFDSFECIFALPHKTKIIRKPEGVGAELKSLCDGESGILLFLEFMEGKDAQALKEFGDVYPSSIAMTMRICKRYFNTGVTLHADSAFSSVACATALMSHGVYFMGCVKTATKKFPKDYLNNWARDENIVRGSHKTLKSTIVLEDNTVRPIFALAWKDLTVKHIVCTRGVTSEQGDPSVRHRRRIVEMEYGHENDRYDLAIPRPQAIQMFYNCFSNIDVHDHYRQGSLAFERNWSTRTWWHRLFMSIFGMICTDAFFAYRLEYRNRHFGDESGMLVYKEFLFRLAFQLINFEDEVAMNLRRRREEEEEEENEGHEVLFSYY
jgi:Transposase IS4